MELLSLKSQNTIESQCSHCCWVIEYGKRAIGEKLPKVDEIKKILHLQMVG
jgi:hypothetical protein